MVEHSNQFQLYHITHIDNLPSILNTQAILSHNQVCHHVDISNQDVNARRDGEEPIFNHSIHDYVPLFFNPRNAMLFSVQCRYNRSDIAILNITRHPCLNKKTLFTYGNAACMDTKFYWDVQEFLDNADWNSINSSEWYDSPDIKNAMMSECLIYDRIPIRYIQSIYCSKKISAQRIEQIIRSSSNINPAIYYGNKFFFDR